MSLEELAANVEVVKQVVDRADPFSLQRTPATGEWSAHDVVCHLLLNEINTASTVRRMLTEDNPLAAEIDDGQVLRFSSVYADTASAFEVWRALREDTVKLGESLTSDELERTGVVMHFGKPVTRTVGEYLEGRAAHDLDHINQIRSALRS